MKTKLSLTTHELGSVTLSNRIVMAPMTRSRAINNIPNDLMATYYSQRATAGLIITEGVSPSLNGLGYARIPGIFSEEQTAGWKQITQAVHDRDGKIFVQLMHTGRIGHGLNLPDGGRVLAPSAIQPKGKMWTDQQGLQDFPVPQALTAEGLQHAKSEFILAARNAVDAGFDGVELHAANGYLLEQLIRWMRRNSLRNGSLRIFTPPTKRTVSPQPGEGCRPWRRSIIFEVTDGRLNRALMQARFVSSVTEADKIIKSNSVSVFVGSLRR